MVYSRLGVLIQGIYNEDLSGGYYEAGGSYLKVGLPKAFSMTQLAWTIVRHRDALYRIGLLDEALGALRWGTNYFVRCHCLFQICCWHLSNIALH